MKFGRIFSGWDSPEISAANLSVYLRTMFFLLVYPSFRRRREKNFALFVKMKKNAANMKLTFMGTGTSQGVPVIGFDNSGLDLSNKKNWRMRSNVHVEAGGRRIQVDAGPEFRIQCLQNSIDWIDLFILTHGHADHIAGMDDLRRFCDKLPSNRLPVYSNEYGLERIRAMFPYALGDAPAQRGYPCFKLAPMPEMLEIAPDCRVRSAPLPHGDIETLGLVFEEGEKKLAYFCDCKLLTREAVELARGADLLVLGALRLTPHPSHMSLEEAVKFADIIGAKTAYFTHMTSHIDYGVWEGRLPKGCHLAYDGLALEV